MAKVNDQATHTLHTSSQRNNTQGQKCRSCAEADTDAAFSICRRNDYNIVRLRQGRREIDAVLARWRSNC